MQGISGFTFLRNAHRLYYPIVESIQSILPIIDEMVVVLGKGDAEDNSIALLQSIDSPKIKIIHSEWDLDTYKNGTIYAQQTDLAKQHCQYDWLFYLQGDEVIHEDDLSIIKEACEQYRDNPKIEGFVFNYLHFFGDYDHYFADHCWYKKEIRIIRNLPEIHSWRDAQSFRWMENFEIKNYQELENSRKLRCILLDARVYHYGWVRPPKVMKQKNNTASSYYGNKANQPFEDNFDYGRLDRANKFNGTHPSVMKDRIASLDWKPLLRHSGPTAINRPLMKHEKLKYRIINFIEQNLLCGKTLGGFNNFVLFDN
jgi:hypothetical protein